MADSSSFGTSTSGGSNGKPHKGGMILALILTFIVIIGGINWFSVGVAKYDLVVHMCNQQKKKGTEGTCPRIIYSLVGVSAILLLILLIVGLAMYKHYKK